MCMKGMEGRMQWQNTQIIYIYINHTQKVILWPGSNWLIDLIVFNATFSNISAISWREQVNFQWHDDEIHFVLDQHAVLDFYSVNSLKQQSVGRHVAVLGHIILIQSQPVCSFSLITNFIVFGFTWSRLEPTIYRTWGEHDNHYATDAVPLCFE